ncbi:tetratricopeptide repeat protein [uncultured Tateyamaria sp.]|uniref:tetratricopeptide repeat protein n=1 Tax=Tateyamaria sp. 1078 TaxID=3417464 RepID=UPI0026352E0E|nr:tetratricopeptide repeat protein [uncultured Tateyamaria sp.]
MSNTDSFIDEVTEEVRRDRLFGYLRRYGWIAVLFILVIVGGAAFNEYRKAQEEAKAQALGDAMLAALSNDDPSARATALAEVSAETPESMAVLALLQAGAFADAGDTDAAIAALGRVETAADAPLIYRQIATFRSLLLQTGTLDAEARRAGFEALAVPGVSFRLLAEEQLALIDIETGNVDAALARLRPMLDDAEASAGLQRRALQAIVALGGTLDDESADDAAEN